jgi:hypothetical protein
MKSNTTSPCVETFFDVWGVKEEVYQRNRCNGSGCTLFFVEFLECVQGERDSLYYNSSRYAWAADPVCLSFCLEFSRHSSHGCVLRLHTWMKGEERHFGDLVSFPSKNTIKWGRMIERVSTPAKFIWEEAMVQKFLRWRMQFVRVVLREILSLFLHIHRNTFFHDSFRLDNRRREKV